MSAGLACVVSNSGGSPELVLDGRNGFVLDSNDIHGHGSAILHLLADDELRSRMAKESRILYLEKFSHEKWQSKMTKLLSETCGLVSGVGKTRGHSI
jgi:glycosyltransferase involved in cell wall biosynthesis